MIDTTKPVTVVVFDIDGTVRKDGEGNDPPKVLMATFRALGEKGVFFAVATGKSVPHAAALMGVIGIKPLVIGGEDGGHISSNLPGFVTDEVSCDATVIRKVRDHLFKCHECNGFELTSSRALAETGTSEENAKKSLVTVFFPDAEKAREKKYIIEEHLQGNGVLGFKPKVTWYPDGGIDVKSSSIATKGGVILWIRDRFLARIKAESRAASRVIVFGDGMNDIPLFERSAVTHSACPANAADPVKELVARRGGYVATTKYGDGTLEAIDYLVTIGALPDYKSG